MKSVVFFLALIYNSVEVSLIIYAVLLKERNFSSHLINIIYIKTVLT